MAISASTTYEILPLEDTTLAVEVGGNSTANNANVRLYSRNDSNAQKWTFSNRSGDVWYIRDAETGKSMEVNKGLSNDKDGANVSMYTTNEYPAQRWKAVPIGTETINGTSYETYQFVAFGGSTATPRCLDVQGNGSYIRSNVCIWGRVEGHPSQTFALVPTEWNAIGGTGNTQTVLPSPTSGTGGTARGTSLPKVCGVSSGTVYPAWKCGTETKYQVRYRTRTRAASAGSLGAWTDWKSISDGSSGFDGWGSVGAANCTPDELNGLLWASQGVSVANSSTYDRTDIEFDVRAWRSNWGVGSTAAAHGGDASWLVSTVRPVTVSALTATLDYDGLHVAWTTDSTRSMTATITCGLFGTVKASSGASGSALIPVESMGRVPRSGGVVEVTCTFVTEDGLTVKDTRSVAVAYADGFSLTITATATVDGSIATVTPSNPGASGWLVVPRGHGDRYIPLEGPAPWKVAPPMGVPWSVYMSDSDGEQWGTGTQAFDPLPADGYHFTSQGLDVDAAVTHGLNGPVEFSPKYQRSHSSAETYGRERSVNVAGNVTDADWTVKGVLWGRSLAEQRDAFDWLAHAGHVIFRSPQGFWAQALVTDAEIDLSVSAFSEVSVSLAEEVW